MKKTAKTLLIFGCYLILAGVAGYLSNPEKAKTALLSGGFFGSLSLLCGLLIHRGQPWAEKAAIALCLLLLAAFTWRATVGWMAVAGGNPDKLFASALISSMWVGAAITLTVLLRRRSL